MSTPLEIVDNAVLAQLTGYSSLTAITSNIAAFDRSKDMRGIDSPDTPAPTIWVKPLDSTVNPYYGGGTTQWVLPYEVGWIRRTTSVPHMRAAQYEILRALLWMVDYKTPGGSAGSLLNAFNPTPWEWHAITPSTCEVQLIKERKANRWQSLVRVTVSLLGNTSDILT